MRLVRTLDCAIVQEAVDFDGSERDVASEEGGTFLRGRLPISCCSFHIRVTLR